MNFEIMGYTLLLIKVGVFFLCGKDRARYFRLKSLLTHLAAKFGFYEREEFLVLRKLIKKGDLVIDVGANVGVYTLYLGKLAGETGAVVAIEPNPEIFEILKYVTRKIPSITLHNFALGKETLPNQEFRVPLLFGLLPEPALGSNSRFFRSFESFKTPVVSLDEIQTFGARISFIKLDTEGSEELVVAGGISTIRRDLPKIQLEVGYAFDSLKSIHSKLSPLGYSCYYVEHARLKVFDFSSNSFQRTAYFFHEQEVLSNIVL